MDKKLENIKLLVLDVDGVLTDGSIVINSDKTETKKFNSLDGHGIRMWQRAGLEVAIISGRFSHPTQLRADQLGIKHVFQDCHYKLPKLKELAESQGLATEQIAYVGDDLPDLPAIRYAGFGVAVANAVAEVKEHADYVTKAPGGSGAAREVIEYILKRTGRWDDLMQRYLYP
ncbi:MAG: HAD hydrolase family protein [Planctomycetes bacterium]|nr:HAD hydrolase family protein [Planctomycetota bacterium]